MSRILSTIKSYLRTNDDIVSPEIAWDAIQSGAFVLDCRSQKEAQNGTLPGATVIPHTEIAKRVDALPQDKESVVVAYCAVGGRSGIVKEYLEGLGYKHVLNGGGIDDLTTYGREKKLL